MVPQIDFQSPVFLDSACIIYFVEGNLDFGQTAQKIIASLFSHHTPLFTSHLVLTEVLTKPFAKNSTDTIINYFNFFKDFSQLNFHHIDKSTAILCAHIRAKYKFRLPDAMLLAQAVESGCKTFLTNDRTLKPFPDIKVVLLSELK